MRTSRRLATIACGVIGTGALVVGTAGVAGAGAQAYDGKASSEALTISILGHTLTTSAASAELQSGHGKASAIETLLAESSATAEQTGPGTKDGNASSCNTQLAQIPALNRADITCGSAKVTINDDGSGVARALGSEVTLEPSVANLLSTLQLQETVQGAAGQVFETVLNPLVQNLTGTPVGEQVNAATDTVEDVLSKVLKLKATARIVVAPALAEVTNANGKLVSHARAQGVRIELLPSDDSLSSIFPDVTAGEPLVTITIGSAEATKTVGDGPTKGVATNALVTVHFGSAKLLDALGLSGTQQDITVPGGQSFCLGLPDPLETCITVASASVDADGNAVADGATVELFKGVQGGIRLATGRATTGGAVTPSAPLAAVAVPTDLPRTGGNAVLPLIGGALLAMAAATRRFSLARR